MRYHLEQRIHTLAENAVDYATGRAPSFNAEDMIFAICSELLRPLDYGECIVTSIRVPLTEEASMVSIPIVLGVRSCGCLLGLGL